MRWGNAFVISVFAMGGCETDKATETSADAATDGGAAIDGGADSSSGESDAGITCIATTCDPTKEVCCLFGGANDCQAIGECKGRAARMLAWRALQAGRSVLWCLHGEWRKRDVPSDVHGIASLRVASGLQLRRGMRERRSDRFQDLPEDS
jgi:hypothetical protein